MNPRLRVVAWIIGAIVAACVMSIEPDDSLRSDSTAQELP